MSGEPRWCPGVRGVSTQHWTTLDNFYIITRKRPEGGTFAPRIDTYCKDCNKARVLKWRRVNRDKVARYSRAWWDKDLEENRRKTRERHRLRSGKNAWTWKRYRVEYEDPRLPVGPFHKWIALHVAPVLATAKEVRAASGAGDLADLITWSWIAMKINVDPKTLPNYVSGKSKSVPREIVDRIGVLFGNMDLSGELYGAAADGTDGTDVSSAGDGSRAA